MVLFLKGILIGIGKMLPGVSGGMIAMMLNVYEEGLYTIAHLKEMGKQNLIFLFFLGSGILIAMVGSSNFILSLLNHYYLPTMLLFIGLMIGGIPSIYREIKKTKQSLFLMLASFFLLCFFSLSTFHTSQNVESNFLSLILIGILDAATMVIPGISGTALLMLLGYYHMVIGAVSKLTNLSSFFLQLPILFPFGIGLLIGIFLFVKLVDYLFSSHKNGVFSVILGFASASTLVLFLNTMQKNYSVLEIIVGLSLFLLGTFISYCLEKIN